MKVLRLARSRVLLWARERGDGAPFEVSKVVGQPLQPRCPSAPLCPPEPGSGASPGVGEGLLLDPEAAPPPSCPYAFTSRGECVSARNQRALEVALFQPGEARLVRGLLEALGYRVEEEPVDARSGAEASRILAAHGCIGNQHEVRVLSGPAGPLVLVRQLRAARRRRQPRERARPIGGLS